MALPFWRTSVKEAALQDFGRFFAKNGVLDQFFNTNLKSLCRHHRQRLAS